jgi:hypothetical protein
VALPCPAQKFIIASCQSREEHTSISFNVLHAHAHLQEAGSAGESAKEERDDAAKDVEGLQKDGVVPTLPYVSAFIVAAQTCTTGHF